MASGQSPALPVPAKIPVVARSPIVRRRTPAPLRTGWRAPAALVVPVALVRIARLPAAAALGEEPEAVVNPLFGHHDRLGRRRARDEAALAGCSAPRQTRCDSWSRRSAARPR